MGTNTNDVLKVVFLILIIMVYFMSLFIVKYTGTKDWMVKPTSVYHGHLQDMLLTFRETKTSDDLEVGDLEVGVKQETCDQQRRTTHIQKLCEQNGWSKEDISLSHLKRTLMVDNKHKLIYCDIPKCGSKSFKHYLGRISTDDYVNGWSVRMNEFLNHTGIQMFIDLEPQEQDKVMKTYYKFMVVRHPLDRLRSAWKHKLSEPGKSHALLGQQTLVNNYLKSIHPDRNQAFHFQKESITFEEYLDLVSTQYRSGFTNQHWTSYYQHCQPCHILYDGVYRLETLSDDIQYFYDHLHSVMADKTDIPLISHENNERSTVTDKLLEVSNLYQNIRPEIIEGLSKVYRKDFMLFGYQWVETQGATCSISADRNYTCC